MRRYFPYFRSFLKPLYPALVGIGLVLFAQILLTVLAPLPIKFILNHLLESPEAVTLQFLGLNFGTHSATSALWILSFAALLLSLALLLFVGIEQVWTGNLSFRVNEWMRRELIGRIFTRRQSYLDSRRKVDLLGRISGDVSNTEALVAGGFATALRDGPMILVLIGMMFLVSLPLTLAFVAMMPFFYFTGHYFTARMRATSRALRRRTITFEEQTYEALQSMAIVKSLRGEEKIQAKLLHRASAITADSEQNLLATQGLEISMSLVQAIVQAGFILLGVWAIFRGELKIGDLFQLQAYMAVMARHLNNINKFISKYPKCSASLERLEELDRDLNLFPEISGTAVVNARPLALSMRGVSFQPTDGRKIFDHFSLDFPTGKLVAVVGQSGIGKSTFSRLLNRLNDPDQGEVFIGGRDARDYDLKNLRSLVRIISQETFLLSGTVRENLTLATGEVAEEEIQRALHAVNAGFLESLPEGLGTKVGEGGRQLSGGQAKRLHLARAFLDGLSDIILFDEPTTGLDTLSAQRVIESISALARHKSLVLWITHRMQEVHSADHVLFFSPGHNPIFSTHDDLFRTNPLYRALMEQSEKAERPGPKETGTSILPGTALP